MQAGVIDCIEVINMMAQIGKLAEAGRVLRHLERSGLFEAPGWRSLIQQSAGIVATGMADERGAPDLTGDRHALEYMGEVLDGLAS